eukprot:365869-Chlamydomonas_euryale.AAC.6
MQGDVLPHAVAYYTAHHMRREAARRSPVHEYCRTGLVVIAYVLKLAGGTPVAIASAALTLEQQTPCTSDMQIACTIFALC